MPGIFVLSCKGNIYIKTQIFKVFFYGGMRRIKASAAIQQSFYHVGLPQLI